MNRSISITMERKSLAGITRTRVWEFFSLITIPGCITISFLSPGRWRLLWNHILRLVDSLFARRRDFSTRVATLASTNWMEVLVEAWLPGRIFLNTKNDKKKEMLPMNRNMRTYFYAVLGAIGGLIGWQISGLLGLSFVTNLYFSEMVVGALVGFSIGLLIGVTEGFITRNIVHASRAGLVGGLLGLVAGGIGLPLSEILFQIVG